MIRPIAYKPPPPPPPKVDPKANAEQITRLQAEATKLRNEIKLAGKMGETDAAASARQRLAEVNTELTTAQPPPPAKQPGPVQPAAVNAANGNGGTTATPALFTTQNFGGTPNLLLTSGEPDGGAVAPDACACTRSAVSGPKRGTGMPSHTSHARKSRTIADTPPMWSGSPCVSTI